MPPEALRGGIKIHRWRSSRWEETKGNRALIWFLRQYSCAPGGPRRRSQFSRARSEIEAHCSRRTSTPAGSPRRGCPQAKTGSITWTRPGRTDGCRPARPADRLIQSSRRHRRGARDACRGCPLRTSATPRSGRRRPSRATRVPNRPLRSRLSQTPRTFLSIPSRERLGRSLTPDQRDRVRGGLSGSRQAEAALGGTSGGGWCERRSAARHRSWDGRYEINTSATCSSTV